MVSAGPSGAAKPEQQNEQQVVPRSYYKVYEQADDIQYAPEAALKEGIGMVKALKANIKRVDLGSKMRQEVWQSEIEKCVWSPYFDCAWNNLDVV